jgi:Ca2+-binding EF-hand superfamily protein
MKKLFLMLVMMAALFTAFTVAQAGQDRDFDQDRQVDQCALEFSQLDPVNSGTINYDQFESAWYGLGTMKGVTPHNTSRAFSADRDRDGLISIAEFCGRWNENTINPRMSG